MSGWVKERHEANKFPWTSWTFLLSLRDFLFLDVTILNNTCTIALHDHLVRDKTFIPGMLLQGIANHAQQIYLSQDEPYAQCLIYYVRDSKSEKHKTHAIGQSLMICKCMHSSCFTCSGAPLLTRCILFSPSRYVNAVLLSVGLNGRKWIS